MESNIYEDPYQRALVHPISPDTKFGKDVRIGYGVVIEKDCVIGDNVFIGHYSILRPNTIVGDDCVIGHLVVCEGDATLGNRTLIQSQCHITKGAIIEDDVFIAPFFGGTNTMRIVHGRNFPLVLKSYKIKRAARIGISVIVLPGLIIGENSLIGAGSVVTHNIPDGEIWFGNPATKHGNVLQEEYL